MVTFSAGHTLGLADSLLSKLQRHTPVCSDEMRSEGEEVIRASTHTFVPVGDRLRGVLGDSIRVPLKCI